MVLKSHITNILNYTSTSTHKRKSDVLRVVTYLFVCLYKYSISVKNTRLAQPN